jgi:type IX secretion system PorP/SprF family membrane protein
MSLFGSTFAEKLSYLKSKRDFAKTKLLMLKILSAIFLLFIAAGARAQDGSFTQYYNLSNWLNPALTGSAPNYRFTTNYRHQWIRIDRAFQSQTLGFDYNADNINSGFGVLITKMNAGDDSQHLEAGATYSYRITTDWFVLRMGLQPSYSIRSLSFNQYVFEDAMRSGRDTQEKLNADLRRFADVATGAAIYNDKFWGGFSLYHLLRPEISAFQKGGERLPVRLNVHAGARVRAWNDYDLYFTPSVQFQKQGIFQQLDMTLGFEADPINFGFAFRGLPFINSVSSPLNQDAFSFLSGFRMQNLFVSFSYDFRVSRLFGSGGSYEITLTYSPRQDNRKKPSWKTVSCPMRF